MELPLDPLQLAFRVVETAREPFLVLDEASRVRFANAAFYARFELDPAETVGRPIHDLAGGQWNIPRLRQLLEQVASGDSQAVSDVLIAHDFEHLGGRSMLLNARKLAAGTEAGETLILLAIEDVTARQRGEARLSRQALEATLLHKATAIAAETSSFEDALEACVEIVCELTGWPAGHVCLPDADDPDRLVTTNIWHIRDRGDADRENAFADLRAATERVRFGRGEGLPGQIRESGEPAWVVNLQESGPHARTEHARRAGVKGAFGFPIKIRGETVAVLEFFSERPMGPDRPLLAMVRSLGEQVGRVIERTRAEAALRRSEHELTELFENAAVGLLFLSPDAYIQRANAALMEMLGYPQHEFVGRPIREFLPEKTTAEAIERCCREGCTLEGYEARLRAKDGSTCHALIDANARTENGRVVYLRCFARDVTDHKRDDSERARLAAIVQSSDDAIIGLSADGLVTSWNRGAERLYGYAADDVVGGSISVVVPAEREEEMTRLLETVKRGERVEQYETIRVHRDGRRLHVAMTASPILAGGAVQESRVERRESREAEDSPRPSSLDSRLSTLDSTPMTAGGPPAVIGVAMIERDVSERKRVAAEIRRAVREAERANRAKGEFLANVSHELRTPMNAIIGMTELALDEPIPDRVRDYLETAKDSAEVLLRLLNDILDFSRIEAGRFELDEAKFDLRQTLEETVKGLSVRAHEKGLEIGLHMPADTPDRLVGDPVRLRQVLANLIGNAIKFTESGEIVVRAEPHALREGETDLHFTVQDTGIGISPADQERIFAPFAQVDSTSTRHHGGAGLGLAICRELVSMMDGRLWVESRLGAGTTFHFTAKFGLQPDTDTPRKPTPVRELRDLPVLVVDDNATNCRILEDTLKSWQMRPVAVRSAEEAFAELRKAAESNSAFPLVIVDGLMPGTDGFTLVERIKADTNIAGATVLMLSSADRRLFRERCEDLDIAAYLEKPVTQSELLDTIVTALQGPPLERDAVEAGSIGGAEQSLSILLVEDTPANRKVVTAVLHKRGHDVTIASDGREAVDLFKQRRDFDVVLMDVQMPNMDGFQATGIIRTIEHSRGGRVPVIAMTAHAMRGDRERCLAAGMDAYISKPIDVRRMIKLVERVARRYSRNTLPPSQRDDVQAAAGSDQTGDAAQVSAALAPNRSEDGRSSRSNGSGQKSIRRTAGATTMAAATSAAAVYDRRSALERLGGDEQLFRELAAYFLEDSETLLRDLDAAAAAGDWPTVRRHAHSLKGLAANFSAKPATEAARELEQAAEGGVSDRAVPLIGRLRTEVERLRQTLTVFAQTSSRT